MALTPTSLIKLGFDAPDFSLIDPMNEKQIRLQDIKGEKGTLVMFICNHCPYVLHIIDGIVDLAREYQRKGIAFVAINSNDVEKYPDDSPELMADFSIMYRLPFPYLFDESQEVAKAYDAACTPDFNLMDAEGKVVYRGRFDAARPGNDIPADGADMRDAFERLLNGQDQNSDQLASIGCNIKWK